MSGFRFRLIDTDGSELAIVTYSFPNIREATPSTSTAAAA